MGVIYGTVSQCIVAMRKVWIFKKKRVLQLMCSIKRNINNGLLKVQVPARYTRIHQGPIIKLPKPENKTLKKRPFYYGCNIWNSLPVHCRNEESMDIFKSNIKVNIFL